MPSFYASAKDKKPRHASMAYYGMIEDIWELDYVQFKIPVFRCSWIDYNKGLIVDDMGFTLVNFKTLGLTDEPFILVSQARQVFYVTDPANSKFSVVINGK